MSTPDFNSEGADLQFNYQSSPFAFWITRRSDPHTEPLFDTRLTSLPKAPTQATVSNGNNVSLQDFNLKFQDQYLEVCFSQLDGLMDSLGLITAHLSLAAEYEHLWTG
jgi:alpha-glucosidase